MKGRYVVMVALCAATLGCLQSNRSIVRELIPEMRGEPDRFTAEHVLVPEPSDSLVRWGTGSSHGIPFE